jgi:hypothetical protein
VGLVAVRVAVRVFDGVLLLVIVLVRVGVLLRVTVLLRVGVRVGDLVLVIVATVSMVVLKSTYARSSSMPKLQL